VSCWLLDLTASALAKSPTLDKFKGSVSDSGEGRWTIAAAIDEGTPAPVLSAALFQRFASRGQDEFACKVPEQVFRPPPWRFDPAMALRFRAGEQGAGRQAKPRAFQQRQGNQIDMGFHQAQRDSNRHRPHSIQAASRRASQIPDRPSGPSRKPADASLLLRLRPRPGGMP